MGGTAGERQAAAPHAHTGVAGGVCECAGDVVDAVDLLLAEADQQAEAATAAFYESAEPGNVGALAVRAFHIAAQALLRVDGPHDPAIEDTVSRFRSDWYEAERIFEGVGHTFLAAAAEEAESRDADRLRRLVEEASLFVEEAHSIIGRIRSPHASVAK